MESLELQALASLGVPAPTYDPASAPRRPVDEALNVPSYVAIARTRPRTSSLDAIYNSEETRRGRAKTWMSTHITERWARPPREDWWREELPVIRKLNECPDGYPRFAAFLDSDDSFMVFRRFGYIQARLLLDKQDQLRILEEELDKQDNIDNEENQTHLQTRNPSGHDMSARYDLFQKLEKTFVEYAQLLTAAQKLRSFERPTSHDYQSVKDWVNNTKPVFKQEDRWVHAKEDIVALRPSREPDWMELFIVRLLVKFDSSLIQLLFTSKDTRIKTGNSPAFHAFVDERIQALALAITTLMISILLVLPIFACYLVVTNISNNKAYAICIGILLMFTLIFSAFVMVFTKAKRHEILAATSAYCAVLVVFLGNVGK